MCSRGSQPDIVCSRKVEGDYYEYFTNVSLDALEFISSGNNSNINPYSLILGKGLLNHIVNNPYGNRIYFLHGDENFKGFSNALL
jgi:hypothetical protein